MALFVLSYARKDGEPLVRKFFDRLCVDLSVMYPQEKEVGFMDTEGIPTGATWQETLGGKLESTPVLVPVFSPSFFASEQCGREVQAFLERLRIYLSSDPPPAVTPSCILPVIWLWENLAIHPTLRNIHYDNVNYPPKYRTKKTGMRMLVDLSKNRDQFKTLTNHLAIAINNALIAARTGAALPPIRTDYRTLPSAFANINASQGAAGPRSVQFAYVAPSRGQLGMIRQNLTTYGEAGRDWRAFDPACPSGIGHLSEAVAANLKMSYDVLSLDQQLTTKLDAVQETKGQVVFVVDSWAAQVNAYDGIFAEIDKEKYRGCPVLIPLNNKDDENRQKRSQLLESLTKRLPGRAFAGGLAFVPDIKDEVEYQSQLGRALAMRQSELIGAVTSTAATVAAPLPTI